MSWFSRRGQVQHGLLVDIGSGSVLVGIVESDPAALIPEIVWAKREYLPRQSQYDATRAAKALMSSLMNALMEVETTGKRRLQQLGENTSLESMCVTIAAPWSYTVVKQIHYEKDESFTITPSLITSLLDTTKQKVTEELRENEVAAQFDLTVTARQILQLSANGYPFTTPNRQSASQLTLTLGSAVTHQYLANSINEAHAKVAPRTTLTVTTFMLLFAALVQERYPAWQEATLIDVTYEATEIGIVSAGALRYCTHAGLGPRRLARDIATIIDAPVADVMSRMQGNTTESFLETMPKGKREKITELISGYVTAIEMVMREAGEAQALPRHLFIHIEQSLEGFFVPLLEAAAHNVTKLRHESTVLTSALAEALAEGYEDEKVQPVYEDTAMLLSAMFFHTENKKGSEGARIQAIL